MNDRGMADGYVTAQDAGKLIGQVDDTIVLDVGMVADDDAIDIRAGNGVVPNAGVIPHLNVPKNDRTLCNINAFPKPRSFVQKPLEPFGKLVRSHPS